MISAFSNTLKIPELRDRILFTLAMIVIVRIGATITLPGVDATVLQMWLKEALENSDRGTAAVTAMLNVFSGGALQNAAIFALGIMPYISASIMMQLLSAVVPTLSKMKREDGGQQKINQLTRYITIALCVFQGFMLAKTLENPANNPLMSGLSSVISKIGLELVPNPGWPFILTTVLVITAGTLLLMWIGEQVTERGIGNGISLIITVNIIAALPGSLVQVWRTYISGTGEGTQSPMVLVLMVGFLLLVIAGVICITQAQRRIAIQYAKRVVGRKVYGGQSTFLPLKVNYSGVMPIIFASAILMFPSQIINWAFGSQPWAAKAVNMLSGGHWVFYALSAVMIFFFSYFWVATMFQPSQIADDLKRNGGYIPGIRPGKPTAEFLDFTMSRLTFAGALFLTVLFLIPALVSGLLKVPPQAAQFFGGTSILILVGVLLDIMRQVETHLLQRHYDGFLRKGKIRGRSDRKVNTGGAPTGSRSTGLLWLYVALAIVIVLGGCYLVYQQTVGN